MFFKVIFMIKDCFCMFCIYRCMLLHLVYFNNLFAVPLAVLYYLQILDLH
jgi:hypothetical protein